jgi:DNA-binding MarR family transcriptional regulator
MFAQASIFMGIDYINDTSSLDTAVAYVIQRNSRLLRFHLAKFFQRVGAPISPEQWFLLFRLYERPGQAQSDLADRDLQDHPNITRLVDALEQRALVERTPDPDDRRRSLVSLTAAGQQLMESLLPQVVAERQRIFQGLSSTELETLVTLLHTIERNLLAD